MRHFTFSAALLASVCLTGCGTKPADDPVAGSKSVSAAENTGTSPQSGAGESGNGHDDVNAFVLSGDNTQVLFTGSKKSGDSHSGVFKTLTGTIAISDSQSIDSIRAEINVESLVADVDRLTTHLKSADFFSQNEYPQLVFESTRIDGSGGQVMVTGNLTMHGVIREISFPANVLIEGEDVKLNSEFTIDRTQFDMTFTGMPTDPINSEVSLKVIVGEGPSQLEERAASDPGR